MRLTLTSRVLSFDLAMFEPLDDDGEPQIRAVAGSPGPADATLAPTMDATAQIPEDRRGFGIVG